MGSILFVLLFNHDFKLLKLWTIVLLFFLVMHVFNHEFVVDSIVKFTVIVVFVLTIYFSNSMSKT